MTMAEKNLTTPSVDVIKSNSNGFSFENNIENLIEQIWSIIHQKASLEELKNLEDKIPELKEKLKIEDANKASIEKMLESLQKYITKQKEDIQSNKI